MRVWRISLPWALIACAEHQPVQRVEPHPSAGALVNVDVFVAPMDGEVRWRGYQLREVMFLGRQVQVFGPITGTVSIHPDGVGQVVYEGNWTVFWSIRDPEQVRLLEALREGGERTVYLAHRGVVFWPVEVDAGAKWTLRGYYSPSMTKPEAEAVLKSMTEGR